MIGATKYTTRETSVTHWCQVPLIFIEDSSISPMHCSEHFVQCSMQFLRRCSMHFSAQQRISAWISANVLWPASLPSVSISCNWITGSKLPLYVKKQPTIHTPTRTQPEPKPKPQSQTPAQPSPRVPSTHVFYKYALYSFLVDRESKHARENLAAASLYKRKKNIYV